MKANLHLVITLCLLVSSVCLHAAIQNVQLSIWQQQGDTRSPNSGNSEDNAALGTGNNNYATIYFTCTGSNSSWNQGTYVLTDFTGATHSVTVGPNAGTLNFTYSWGGCYAYDAYNSGSGEVCGIQYYTDPQGVQHNSQYGWDVTASIIYESHNEPGGGEGGSHATVYLNDETCDLVGTNLTSPTPAPTATPVPSATPGSSATPAPTPAVTPSSSPGGGGTGTGTGSGSGTGTSPGTGTGSSGGGGGSSPSASPAMGTGTSFPTAWSASSTPFGKYGDNPGEGTQDTLNQLQNFSNQGSGMFDQLNGTQNQLQNKAVTLKSPVTGQRYTWDFQLPNIGFAGHSADLSFHMDFTWAQPMISVIRSITLFFMLYYFYMRGYTVFSKMLVALRGK